MHHEVDLVAKPSSKAPVLLRLKRGTILSLLNDKCRHDYYRARMISGGTEGWIYRTSARRFPGAPPGGPGVTSPPVHPGVAEQVASSILTGWEKPQPETVDFKSPESDRICSKFGDEPGNLSNLRKNREDPPSTYHEVVFDAFALLPKPELPRSQWAPEDIGAIKGFEGVALSVTGYLVNKIKVQTTGRGESTNCRWKRASEVDWHMALVKSFGDPEKTAIVVEVTPRVRKDHPRWTVAALSPWVNMNAPVRISGWLLYDYLHKNHLTRYRSTLWEIHPITRIEVFDHDKWSDLDALPSEDDDEGE
ncbi:MAG TPA: hypothetical protein VN999_02830 [Thermoanaerobaculia bacterium]|nr:hypothetical protein [Thermoanaerobaculia bacterium]